MTQQVEKLALDLGQVMLRGELSSLDAASGALYDAVERDLEEFDEVVVLDIMTVTRLPRGRREVVSVRMYESADSPIDDRAGFQYTVHSLTTSGALR